MIVKISAICYGSLIIDLFSLYWYQCGHTHTQNNIQYKCKWINLWLKKFMKKKSIEKHKKKLQWNLSYAFIKVDEAKDTWNCLHSAE